MNWIQIGIAFGVGALAGGYFYREYVFSQATSTRPEPTTGRTPRTRDEHRPPDSRLRD